MPELSFITEERVLRFLWSTTLLLCVLSYLALTLLLLRRIGLDRRRRNHEARVMQFRNILIAAISAPGLAGDCAAPQTHSDFAAAIDAGLDTMRAVAGADASAATAMLINWKLANRLHRWLRRGDSAKKIKALTLLVRLDHEAGLTAAETALRDKNLYVRLTALRILASEQAFDRLDAIVAALTAMQAGNDRVVADILSRFPEGAGPHFIKLAFSGADLQIRVAALRACARLRCQLTPRQANALFVDPSPEIRAQATDLVGLSPADIAAPFIERAFRDRAVIVRIHAARVTGAMRFQSLAPRLVSGLEDENWWVRYRCAEALANFGDSGQALLLDRALSEAKSAPVCRQVLSERSFDAAA